MTDLSPAAQAVLDVYWKNVGMPAALAKELGYSNNPLATALRAAADQLREAYTNEEYVDSADDWLDDIAAELEALPND